MPIRHATVRCLVLATITALAGCKSLTPREAKNQAEGRWNRIRADFKLQLARQHYDAKLFGESESAATEALTFDPTLVDAYVVLARSSLELGKPTSALRAIETARRAGLDSADLSYTQGVVYETQGDLPLAGSFYVDACQKDMDRVDFVIAYAECVVGMGKPDVALNRLDALVGRYDDDGSVLLLSAHIASLMGDTEGAIRRYRLALDALGNSRMASRELGLLLVDTGRYEEAIETLDGLPDETSADVGDDVVRDDVVRLALAKANLRSGRPMKAMTWLEPESREESRLVAGYAILAEAALATDDVATGLAATSSAMRLSPDAPDLVLLHATALWRHGDHPAAERRLRLHLERYVNDATAHCLLAEVLRSQGDTGEARTHFQIASDLSVEPLWADQGLASLDADSPTEVPELTPVPMSPQVIK